MNKIAHSFIHQTNDVFITITITSSHKSSCFFFNTYEFNSKSDNINTPQAKNEMPYDKNLRVNYYGLRMILAAVILNLLK